MEEVIADHPMEYDDNKFLVLESRDLAELDAAERYALSGVLASIMKRRKAAGVSQINKYFVVNQDEPYAGQILHDILIAEEKKAWAIQQGLWPKPRRRKTDSS